MGIFELLQQKATEEIQHYYGESVEPSQIQVQPTKKEYEGDFTIVTFPLAKILKTSPDQIAENIGSGLAQNLEVIRSYQVAGGFLNLSLFFSYWVDIVRQNYPLGRMELEPHKDPDRVMVEYSSPNTNKPLHLGHIRNNVLGWSVAEILKERGHDVVKACLFNDRGAGIARTIVSWENFAEGETPADAHRKGDHFVGDYYVKFAEELDQQIQELVEQGYSKEEAEKEAPINKRNRETLRKWEEGDEEVINTWKKLNNWVYQGFEETYKRMGVDFDCYYYESDTYLLGRDIVNEGLEKGVFYQKDDGSVWIDLEDEGLGEKLLLRSDGTSVYITQDLGTAELKYKDYQPNRSIYVVGNEQDYHFQVLKAILRKLGKSYAEGIYHLSYGMVDLPTGKMKSREGTVVDADELLDEVKENAAELTFSLGKIEEMDENEREELFEMIGQGALKFFILKSDAHKRITFSPEESIDFQGFTGPFVQYTHARICSLLKKTGYNELLDELPLNSVPELGEKEIELVRQLFYYQSTIEAAEKDFNPSEIAHYVYHLAKSFNRFYHEYPVKNEKDEDKKSFRLMMTAVVRGTVKHAMRLLGIQVPQRM